jgi:hypothetical protein
VERGVMEASAQKAPRFVNSCLELFSLVGALALSVARLFINPDFHIWHIIYSYQERSRAPLVGGFKQ